MHDKTYEPQPVIDTIPHSELMQCAARRIVDKHMLHLIKMWPKVPVEERDAKGKKRFTAGKRTMIAEVGKEE